MLSLTWHAGAGGANTLQGPGKEEDSVTPPESKN